MTGPHRPMMIRVVVNLKTANALGLTVPENAVGHGLRCWAIKAE